MIKKIYKDYDLRPKCSVCHEHIQEEEYIDINGEIFCNGCEESNAATLWYEFGREMFVEKG